MSEVMNIFSNFEETRDMLEDAAAVLAMMNGVEALLRRLNEERPASPLRMAGLKALFELGRADCEFLTGNAAKAAMEACEKLVMEERNDAFAAMFASTSRLEEVASLLSGLCQGRLRLQA
eukprot:TRINITY_DN4830_c2_g1_i1.p1 TRINITY_DN4830_c2_g1~~TRINITY_DN4830_c2_g1_i1.p1  ORF type:complete len:120 (-),score=28.49 TRINITY_DN4830_c2_g1_i1:62-421(-)